MNAFDQALKVDDTPFPFPYAQTVTMMLWFQALLCPFTMVAWLNNTIVVVLFTLATVWSTFTLNEVSTFEQVDLSRENMHAACVDQRISFKRACSMFAHVGQLA
jgi:predicted membrane chloride channel (bestrophin family)